MGEGHDDKGTDLKKISYGKNDETPIPETKP
jgi:hypothetical protein